MLETTISLDHLSNLIFKSAWDACYKQFKDYEMKEHKVIFDLTKSEGLSLDESQLFKVCRKLMEYGNYIKTEDNCIRMTPAIKNVKYNFETIEFEFNVDALENRELEEEEEG